MNESDLIKQFDNISPIQPSIEWKDDLFSRIEQNNGKTKTVTPGKLLLTLFVILLLCVNVYSVTNTYIKLRNHKGNNNKMKVIAREFLIQTSSSNY